MVRNYKRVLGPTGHQNYNESALSRAVQEVRAGKTTVRQASEKYGVPKSTISDHLKASRQGAKPVSPGGQPVFSEKDEKILAKGLMVCGDWGYPLRGGDVKDTVQTYLNRQGRVVKQFRENRPGSEWLWAFLKRNQNLSQRLAENIKSSRAAVDEEVLGKYFDRVEETLSGVPPENIINFDETNCSDDPGAQKVIVRRGSRHPERIMDHSKSCTSVMFAASGSGELLPPYIVFKSQYLYPTWTEGCLPGTRFGCSTSGWFDMRLFEDWFLTVCIPFFRNKIGRKAAIGDNLPSHISLEVIRLSKEHDIEFILLPPNATHLCQPLDVSVFRPLKRSWRTVLSNWKMANRGPIPKAKFPGLLRETIVNMGDKIQDNIKAGFRASGLIPINRDQVLKRIPRVPVNESPGKWTSALVQKLEEKRRADTSTKTKRGRRLQFEAGSSLTRSVAAGAGSGDKGDIEIIMAREEDAVEEPKEKTTRKKIKRTRKPSTESDEETVDDPPAKDPEQPEEIKEGDFVLVDFVTKEDRRSKMYVGQVMNILNNEEWETKFMRKKVGKEISFSFPQIPDIETISPKSVHSKLHFRDLRRGRFCFPNLGELVSINNVF